MTILNTQQNQKADENIEDLLKSMEQAATIINAYARGYLVRRLFKTEKIQRVVQTITDTLKFVIYLHLESEENPEANKNESDNALKCKLLQQLESAANTLHIIFFQISPKERMEIIANDREQIKSKTSNKF